MTKVPSEGSSEEEIDMWDGERDQPIDSYVNYLFKEEIRDNMPLCWVWRRDGVALGFVTFDFSIILLFSLLKGAKRPFNNDTYIDTARNGVLGSVAIFAVIPPTLIFLIFFLPPLDPVLTTCAGESKFLAELRRSLKEGGGGESESDREMFLAFRG